MEETEQMASINLLKRLQRDHDEVTKEKEIVTIKRNIHRCKTSTSTIPKATLN
jgi:hypothetical protein